MAKLSLQEVAAQLEKEMVRTTILSLKLIFMEYNSVVKRLRSPEYKEVALKNIRKIGKELEGTGWPDELKEQVNGLRSDLETLTKHIKAEDFTRFQPVQNRIKRSFETLDEKWVEWARKS